MNFTSHLNYFKMKSFWIGTLCILYYIINPLRVCVIFMFFFLFYICIYLFYYSFIYWFTYILLIYYCVWSIIHFVFSQYTTFILFVALWVWEIIILHMGLEQHDCERFSFFWWSKIFWKDGMLRTTWMMNLKW